MLVHPAGPDHRRRRHHPGRQQRRPDRLLRLRQRSRAGRQRDHDHHPDRGSRARRPTSQFAITGTATATSGRPAGAARDHRPRHRPLPPGRPDDAGARANTINATLASPDATSTDLVAAADDHRQPPAAGAGPDRRRQRHQRRHQGDQEDRDLRPRRPDADHDRSPARRASSPTTDLHRHRHGDRRRRRQLDHALVSATRRTATCRTTAPPTATYNTFRCPPDVIGATSATWSDEVTVPYESEWTMQAIAVDTAGQSDLRSADRDLDRQRHRRRPDGRRSPRPPSMSPPTAALPLTWRPVRRSPSPARRSTTSADQRRDPAAATPPPVRTSPSDGTWGADVVGRLVPDLCRANLSATSYNWSYTTPFNLVPGTYIVLGAGHRRPRPHDVVGATTAGSRSTSRSPATPSPTRTLNATGTVTGLPSAAPRPRRHRHRRPGRRLGQVDRRVTATAASTSSRTAPWPSAYALLATDLATPGAHLDRLDPQRRPARARATTTSPPSRSTPSASRTRRPPARPPATWSSRVTSRRSCPRRCSSPTEGTAFTESRIVVSGRVEDDQQIRQVQVAVRNGARPVHELAAAPSPAPPRAGARRS